ncbi:MAG: DNA polymerase ligase N-terminal domain-containing protein [Planctomycetia bacterium]|nr:DNA polymerase ligase N-terminal domain-containing protein [Planctomycetia bacterium]
MRAAVQDHELDYANFSGTIAAGEYGAGSVEIWDSGTVKYESGADGAEADLEAGILLFTLNGKRLTGRWKLIRVKAWEANSWLLIKRREK